MTFNEPLNTRLDHKYTFKYVWKSGEENIGEKGVFIHLKWAPLAEKVEIAYGLLFK